MFSTSVSMSSLSIICFMILALTVSKTSAGTTSVPTAAQTSSSIIGQTNQTTYSGMVSGTAATTVPSSNTTSATNPGWNNWYLLPIALAFVMTVVVISVYCSTLMARRMALRSPAAFYQPRPVYQQRPIYPYRAPMYGAPRNPWIA